MMNVTLAQLRTFERIVRLGSFNAAAQNLSLTQPSISQRMRELEDALGTKLFIRRGPKINITAEGTALLAYADRMLETVREMSERFRTRNPLIGQLRLGLNETFGQVCLPELLRRLEGRYPALETSMHVGDTPTVSRLLNDRQLDVAVISEPDVADHVRREAIGTNELSWFASNEADIPRGVLTPQDLGSHHLVVSPPPARLYTTAMRWFSQAGVEPQRISMCNSLLVTIPTILSGLAIGLIPARVMADKVARGEVRRLNVSPPLPGHRVSICYQISEFGPGLQEVVQLVRELVQHYRVFV
ncbi:MAG TPA: LysR family transcriptional regulator [Magnetospirillaceae bacterium]|jgi:DNA-binding transcriptional LysR family regulator